jgi:hypothetical protein
MSAAANSGKTVESINSFAEEATNLIPTVKEFMKAAEESTYHLSDFTKRATDTLSGVDEATSSAEQTFSGLNSFGAHLQNLPAAVYEFVMNLVKDHGTIFIPIFTILLCWHFYRTRNPLTVFIAKFLIMFHVGAGFGVAIMEIFKQLKDDTQVQSDSVLTSLAVLAYSAFGIHNAKGPMVNEFVNLLQKIPRGADGFDKIIESVKTVACFMLQFVERNSAETIYDTLCYGRDTDFSTFVDDVKLIAEESQSGLHITQGNRLMVQNLISKGETMLLSLSKQKKNIEASYIQRLLVDLKKILASISERAKGKPPVRIEPVGFVLRGQPGVGKSVAMELFQNIVLKSTLSTDHFNAYLEDKRNAVYTRVTQTYWEGYKPSVQLVYYDDFLQIRDVPGGTSQAAEIIGLVNVAPYPLDMAFEQKGNVFAEPNFVFATTNQSKFSTETINDPGALSRRFHIQYRVTVKPEYADKEGKYKVIEGQELNPQHWNFHEQESDRFGFVKDTGRIHSFDAICHLLVARHKAHQEKRKIMEEYSQKNLKTINVENFSLEDFLKEEEDEKYDTATGPEGPECMERVKEVTEIYNRITGLSWECGEVYTFLIKKGAYEILTCHPKKWAIIQELGDDFWRAKFMPVLNPYAFATEHEFLNAAANAVQNVNFIRFQQFIAFLWKHAGTIASVVTIVTVITMATKTFSVEETDEFFQSSVDGRNAAPISQKYQRAPRLSDLPKGHSDTQMNHEQIHVGVGQVRKHYYTVTTDNCSSKAGYAISLGGKFFMMPNHFIHEIHAAHDANGYTSDQILATNVIFTKVVPEGGNDPENQIVVKFEQLTANANDELYSQDCLVFTLPCRDKPRLTQHFISDEEKGIISFNVMYKMSGSLIRETSESYFQGADPVHHHTANSKSGPLSFKQMLRYFIPTEAGDCGLLTIGTEKFGGKILSMHAAGNSRYGLGCFITREMLEGIMDKMVGKVPKVSTKRSLEIVKPGHSTNRRTNIVQAESNFKPCNILTAPANLTSEAYDIAMAKYVDVPFSASMDILVSCSNQLLSDLSISSRPYKPRIFTFEEAVFGVPESDFTSISATTSAGFPFNTLGFAGKTKYFKDGEFTEYADELLEIVQRTIDTAADGLLVPIVVQDHLKDERRPIAKVDSKTTRLISAAPLHSTIAFRMYFGAFMEFLNGNKILNGCAMGVNPYGDDVDAIVHCLLLKGKDPDSHRFGAGDYSGFDRSEVEQVHWILYEMIERWYGECATEDRVVRRTLWRTVSNSVHMWRDSIREWRTSLPSGHPLTTVINCLYNLLAFRYCWVRSHDNDLSMLPLFRDHIYVIVLGDDNLFSVTQDVETLFTESKISVFMKEMGLTYTNDKKTEHTSGLRNLWDVTFLKRSFQEHDKLLHKFVMPLDLQVILETTCWTKQKDRVNILCSNAEFAVRELTLHGEDCFNHNLRKLLRFHDDMGTNWHPITRDYATYRDTVCKMVGYL